MPTHMPIIIQCRIDRYKNVPCTETRMILIGTPPLAIASCPVMVTAATMNHIPHSRHPEQSTRMLDIQGSLSVNCICIDDICGSVYEWCNNNESRSIQWNVTSIFLNSYSSLLFTALHPRNNVHIIPIDKLRLWVIQSAPQANLLEATFVPNKDRKLIQWLKSILTTFFGIIMELRAIDYPTL